MDHSRFSHAKHEPRVLAFPMTQEDVIDLRRLGSDVFEATKRSGELWVGDAELLQSLPQGMAKLATLTARERVSARKPTATRELRPCGETTSSLTCAAGTRDADAKSAEPPEKKAYKEYMHEMLSKREQETHDGYKFSLAELDANENLNEEDKDTVRTFLIRPRLEPEPPTCAPPTQRATAIGAGPPACAPLMQRSGTKRHNRTLEPQAPACAPPPNLRQGQRDTTGPSGHRGRPSGPRLQPSRGLSPE